MKRLISLCAALLAAAAAVIVPITFSSSAQAGTQPRKILTGWLPYYSMKTSLPAVTANVDLIREVMPFWYTLKYNGSAKGVTVSDLYTPANPSVPMSTPLITLRGAGMTIIPTITDGTAKMVLSNHLSTAAGRTQTVQVITNLVTQNNFDGIDLDFEGFAFVDGNTSWTTTAPRWVAFVKELSAALHAQKKILSVSTPYLYNPTEAQKGYYVYDWQSISTYIDRLRIMTYDYSVARPGPIGPLAWAEKTIKYAVSVMPASKVYVGLAGYGRDWVTSVAGTCPSDVASVVKAGAKAATFVMRDAASLAQSYGATPNYDTNYGESTFTYQKVYNGVTASGLATSCTASRTAWYQDSRSYLERAGLVAKYRLGGLTAWTLGMEDALATANIRQTALAISPDEVKSTFTIATNSLEYGGTTTISGTFQLPDKQAVAGVLVYLESKRPGESQWQQIYSMTSQQDGTVSIPITLAKSTSLRLRSEGTWERLESVTTEQLITVKRKLTMESPVSIPRSVPFQITGTVAPAQNGSTLTLSKWINGKWSPVGVPATTDVDGKFVLTSSEANKGFVKYRVILVATARDAEVVSTPFTVVVR